MDRNIGSIRQGDVLLVPVEVTPPANAKSTKSVVIAEGEITGHSHKLTAEQGILSWDDFVVVQGTENGQIQHEDHDPNPAAVVPAGVVFRVVHQREYTLSEQWERVRD